RNTSRYLTSISHSYPPNSSSTATPPTELYTLSLHDALPIFPVRPPARGHTQMSARSVRPDGSRTGARMGRTLPASISAAGGRGRSEEHTSELQSRGHLVCRLLLEKKKQNETTRKAGRVASRH